MNKKTLYLSYIFLFLFGVVFFEIAYLSSQKAMSSSEKEKKGIFVSLVGLPDLAVSTEATYIRNRSLSDLFAIYKDGPTLREYFPSTYAISHSHIINPHTKINHEK